MSTRSEFDDEDLPPVLQRLIVEGKLRDYVLIELYATAPLSVERLVQIRGHDLHQCPGLPEAIFMEHRGGLRRIHLTEDGLFAIGAWMNLAGLEPLDYLFPSSKSSDGHLCARQARRIIEAQFDRPHDHAKQVATEWQTELAGDFECRLSRWPWVTCVRAQSGDRCATHCEGLPVRKHRRPFRRSGIVSARSDDVKR